MFNRNGRQRGVQLAERPKNNAVEELLRQFQSLEESRNLPVERNGQTPGPRKEVSLGGPCLELSANGKTVRVPAGSKVMGLHLKQMLDIYEGMELFVRNGHGWRRVQDHEMINLDEVSELEARHQPVQRVQPRHVPQFRID